MEGGCLGEGSLCVGCEGQGQGRAQVMIGFSALHWVHRSGVSAAEGLSDKLMG